MVAPDADRCMLSSQLLQRRNKPGLHYQLACSSHQAANNNLALHCMHFQQQIIIHTSFITHQQSDIPRSFLCYVVHVVFPSVFGDFLIPLIPKLCRHAEKPTPLINSLLWLFYWRLLLTNSLFWIICVGLLLATSFDK